MNGLFTEEVLLVVSLLSVSLLLFFLGKPSRHRRNVRKSKVILNKVSSFDNPGSIFSYLRKIDPFVFEELVLESFKRRGYKIIRNKRYTGDGGIDGQVIRDGKLYLIQAKRYSSAINPQHITDFGNVIEAKNAEGGFFVHTGRTGKMSYNNLQGLKIEIISGNRLLKLLQHSVEK